MYNYLHTNTLSNGISPLLIRLLMVINRKKGLCGSHSDAWCNTLGGIWGPRNSLCAQNKRAQASKPYLLRLPYHGNQYQMWAKSLQYIKKIPPSSSLYSGSAQSSTPLSLYWGNTIHTHSRHQHTSHILCMQKQTTQIHSHIPSKKYLNTATLFLKKCNVSKQIWRLLSQRVLLH